MPSNGLGLNFVVPPMKWAECIRMNGRWTKSQWLTRFLTVLCNAFATLYAVAASEFDLTDQP